MSQGSMQLGKVLLAAGVVLAGVGLVLIFGSRYSFLGLGKLPGDISYKSKNVTFYFPLVTCLLLSALLTIIFWLVSLFTWR